MKWLNRKKKNWLRWLLAEEMVAKKNGLAELAVEVLRQMVKKTKELTKPVEKRCWQKGRFG